MATERLQKILANAGVASRRRAEELIVTGRVAVNGVTITTLGARADPAVDLITFDGVPVIRDRYRYLALNKPAGLITTVRDERGRSTVFDVLPSDARGLHPVGRLDRDSEGLLILTNDGALTAFLTHPRHGIEKEYLVDIDAPLGHRALQRLVRGLDIEGEHLKSRSVTPLGGGDAPGSARLSMVLSEGRKREIRRMMTHLGRTVLRLQRVRIASLRLGGLEPGAWRPLNHEEVEALYEAGKRSGAVGDVSYDARQDERRTPPQPNRD